MSLLPQLRKSSRNYQLLFLIIPRYAAVLVVFISGSFAGPDTESANSPTATTIIITSMILAPPQTSTPVIATPATLLTTVVRSLTPDATTPSLGSITTSSSSGSQTTAKSSSLSGGQIAGVFLGSVGGVVCFIILLWYFCGSRKHLKLFDSLKRRVSRSKG